MKITKTKLKQIIKEELSALLENGDPMEVAANLQSMLENIAHWMEENFGWRLDHRDVVEEWIALANAAAAKKGGDDIPFETEQALLDMSDEIYNYMD